MQKVIFIALFALASAQHLPTHGVPATDDGDDGSYNSEKYEAPYLNEVSNAPQRGYQAQPQYRPAPQQYQPQQQYQPAPQPQYQSAPQPQYRAPAPQYSPAPQQYQYRSPQTSSYRQGGDPRNAAILSEARYLQGDGKFGAAYTQEDGVEFKEESDADGTRRGSYSWVDPDGQKRTVSYTAGKNGFQASGAHLPVGPAAPPAPQPQARQYSAPQPQYQAAPQYQPAQPQYRPQSNYY